MQHRRLLITAAVVVAVLAFAGCDYVPPPEVELVPPEEGVFFVGDPVRLEFDEPIIAETLEISVWPNLRTIENELRDDIDPLLDGCTPSSSPCGNTLLTVDEDRMGATVIFDPETLGRPDRPLIMIVAEGLESDEGGITGTRLLFDFQFKPDNEGADLVPFMDGDWLIISEIEEPVPTILLLITSIERDEGNRLAIAGAEADVDDGVPLNTTNPDLVYVDETDQGFVVFAYAGLRETEDGERFLETDPFELALRLGPITATVRNTRLTGIVVADDDTGDDRIEGTLSFDAITLDTGNGMPFDFPPGTTTFLGVYVEPERVADGAPQVCGDLCGAATSQCEPPEDFPGDGFCGESSGEEETP